MSSFRNGRIKTFAKSESHTFLTAHGNCSANRIITQI